MAANIVNISDDTFEKEVVQSTIPVLVDFWAEWCGPCHLIAPAIEHIAETYQNKLRVAKMNVDENMKTPSKYGILSIPTLLFFKAGELKEAIVGVQPQDKIEERIARHL